MTPSSQAAGLLRIRSTNICSTCWRKLQLQTKVANQQRAITQNWLRKTADAETAWKEQAKEIWEGKKESMLSILEKRGYINAVVGDRDKLNNLMIGKRVGAYVGIDPTGPSLHLGHLLPLMSIFWMYVHGFKTLSLIGGATAQIGDPTGRTTTREPLTSSNRKLNIINIHLQLKSLWVNMESHAKRYGYNWEWAWRRDIANNNTWMNKLPMIEFMKLVGTASRIGTMLGRDTVRNKMEKGDGMSYAEFSYPLIQAWDFWQMYDEKKIQLQVGGADQYGNILAGVDVVKYIIKNHYDPLRRQEKEDPLMMPMGFTTPLLTTSSGEKLGKSAGNAIWLGRDMLSTFDFYQHFIRLPDADVGRYLKLFTFIPLSSINDILTAHTANPKQRSAQHTLAKEVVTLVHGEMEAKRAENEHSIIFPTASKETVAVPTNTPTTDKVTDAQDIIPPPKPDPNFYTSKTSPFINASLNKHASQVNSSHTPAANITLPRSLIYGQPIARVLYYAGLASSRSEGHRLAANRGAYVGSRPGQKGKMPDMLTYTPILNWNPKETEKYVIEGELLVLRVGKWKVKVIKIVSDEEFDAMGLDTPGWQEFKEGTTDVVDPIPKKLGPKRITKILKN